MKLGKIAAVLAAGCFSSTSFAGYLLNEGFNNVASLAGQGWVRNNASVAPLGNWFQGDAGIFASQAGAAGAYVGSNFLAGNPSISNWLITPQLFVGGVAQLSFWVRTAGSIGFLDTVEVWLSTNGASTALSDFNISLGKYASTTDQGWVQQVFSLNIPTSGRVAFRYVVPDTNAGGDYVGIDSVQVIPEPTGLALAGLGLGLLALRRRRA